MNSGNFNLQCLRLITVHFHYNHEPFLFVCINSERVLDRSAALERRPLRTGYMRNRKKVQAFERPIAMIMLIVLDTVFQARAIQNEKDRILTSKPAVTSGATLEALTATGPHEAYRDKLMLFGQFVGNWEADFTVHNPDGSSQIEKAEWQWAWILEGRAIQDVWILPRRSDRETSNFDRPDYGTAIRSYDPTIDAWRVVWVSPAHGELFTFTAQQVSDEIVLEGKGADGLPMRWIFSDITHDLYHWRRVHSYDGGKSWQVQKEMSVRRIDSAK